VVSYHLGRPIDGDNIAKIERNIQHFFSSLNVLTEPIFVIVNVDGNDNPFVEIVHKARPPNTCIVVWSKTESDMKTHALLLQAIGKRPVSFFFALNQGVVGPLSDESNWPQKFTSLFTENVKMVGATSSCEVSLHIQTHFFVLHPDVFSLFVHHQLQRVSGDWSDKILHIEVGFSTLLIEKNYRISSLLYDTKFKLIENCPNYTNPSFWCGLALSDVVFLKYGGEVLRQGLICEAMEKRVNNFFVPVSSNSSLTCVFVRTTESHVKSLPVLFMSLISGRIGPLKIVVADTSGKFSLLEKIIADTNKWFGDEIVFKCNHNNESKIKRCPLMKENDYGYVTTDLMLEDGLADKCDYILFTNGDNVYLRDFFNETIGAIKEGAHIVGTNFISHYEFGSKATTYGPMRSGRDTEFVPTFRVGLIDLGSVLFRVLMFKRYGIRFLIESCSPSSLVFDSVEGGCREVPAACADGFLSQRISEIKGIVSRIIPRVLFVHQ
jgi:hypothetical protein